MREIKLSSLVTEREKMMMVMTTEICNATPSEERSNKMLMGAESYVIALDSCCSYSIARRRSDFCGKMTTCDNTIQKFKGKSIIPKKGTWKFKMEDNEGTTHDILIAKQLYAPNAPFHLLSLQHSEQYILHHTTQQDDS